MIVDDDEHRSVWYDLADTPAQAAALTVRSALLAAITEKIKANGWTARQAAAHMSVTVDRADELLRGQGFGRYTVEDLIGMAAAIGVYVTVEPLTMA